MGISFWLALHGSRGHRRGRRTLVVLAVALALLLPTAAIASHQFGDVPTTHTFHNNISNLANAGITGGCGGGNFCPDTAVTRAQMAGFLNRGLGRVAEADFVETSTAIASTTFGSVTITPGTVGTGTQFVYAQFTGTITFEDAAVCPCQVAYYLRRGATPLPAAPNFISVSTNGDNDPISTSGVIAVTGGGPVTIELRASVSGAEHPAATVQYTIQGNIASMTIPFGSTGTSAP